MSHKDDYFDGDTHDLLLYKIAQRDKVIEKCRETLESVIIPSLDHSYGTIYLWRVREALAAIEELKEKS